ncbi:MAG: DUF6502 family protein [Planctomycetota bacterium]|nr:DUF6502 family protein [Planctomycetota bacterium]
MASDAVALAAALDRLLEPLVEVLLRGGVPHRAFADLAKRAYVRVAEREGAADGRAPSVSSLAVRTGLTRKEVSRLRNLPPPPPEETSARYNRAARVLTGWVRDERFQAGGEPIDLEFDGEGATFATLVRAYAGDVPPRAVLDELERVGVVERTEAGRVRLLRRGYLPRRGEAERLQILGADVAGLIGTIRRNLDAEPDDAFFQRKVFYDNLAAGALPALRALSAREGQALLERLDAFMAEHDLDVHPDPGEAGGRRAGIGLYYFEEPPQEVTP